MNRISAWFDRHPRTRIALQLMLDGLPFLLLIFPFTVGVVEVNCATVQIPRWLDATAMASMQLVMFGGGAVLFLLSMWLRSRAESAFARHSWCKALCVALRVLSFVPAVLSAGLCIGLLYYYFKNR